MAESGPWQGRLFRQARRRLPPGLAVSALVQVPVVWPPQPAVGFLLAEDFNLAAWVGQAGAGRLSLASGARGRSLAAARHPDADADADGSLWLAAAPGWWLQLLPAQHQVWLYGPPPVAAGRGPGPAWLQRGYRVCQPRAR